MLTIALVSWLAIAALLGTWQFVVAGSGWASGFSAGLMLGLLPLFWQMFLTAHGLAHRSMGVEAEAWSGSELRKLKAPHWRIFHDVFLGDVNVDHVAVGAKRLYAIETKWVGQPPDERYLKRLAGVARGRAAALERALSDAGLGRQVTPLLVVWGRAGADAIPDGGRHLHPMQVTAVAGADAATWLARMETASRGLHIDWPVIQALEKLQEETVGTDSLPTRSP